ncbi:hypothetical protein Cni_G16411 [Canna indica]|uniref:Uncharacterized protein n=1 Tax=Canna indica TaxID=4628 RepID=A0AAQ3QE60_9LILI|nr:hypothetical protein Cni_G16411 [Canna indica]
MVLTFGLLILHHDVETLEHEVKISPGRPDIVLPLPVVLNSKGVWFTLEKGSQYKLIFSFTVNNNIACGLRYTNTVWKTGVKDMLLTILLPKLFQILPVRSSLQNIYLQVSSSD